MDKNKIIEILNSLISTTENDDEREIFINIKKQLNSVTDKVNNLKDIDLNLLRDKLGMTKEEMEELTFYKILSQIEVDGYGLTDEQRFNLNRLLNKYLELIYDKENEQNYVDRVKELVKKINNEDILSKEDIIFINSLMNEKNLDMKVINRVIADLVLDSVKKLEKKTTNVKNEEKEEVEKSTTKLSDKDKNIDIVYDLFTKYGIFAEQSQVQHNIVMECVNGDVDNLKNILEKLNKLGISFGLIDNSNVNSVIQLLTGSSAEIIEKVIDTAAKLFQVNNQECFNYLFQRVSIFMADKEVCSYDNFINNMKMFQAIGFNKEEFLDIPLNTLCHNFETVKRNVIVLEKYRIPRKKYLASYLPIAGWKFDSELDKWLELETNESREYLRNHFSVLGNMQSKIYTGLKLRIFKNLNIPITKNGRRAETNLLNREMFYELDACTDSVIVIGNKRYNNTFVQYIHKDEETDKFDKIVNGKRKKELEDRASSSELYNLFVNSFPNDNMMCYYMSGVNIGISKNKVYRVYNTLLNNGISDSKEVLMYAITYKSIINKEEYESIYYYVQQLLNSKLDHKGGVR